MNFEWNLRVFVCICLAAMVAARPSTRHLELDDGYEIKIEDSAEVQGGFEYQRTIHYFARHILCHDISGQTAFVEVMARKLSTLNKLFVESFVYDMCRLHSRNDSILDRWVRELFDTDNDGYISEEEMRFHH